MMVKRLLCSLLGLMAGGLLFCGSALAVAPAAGWSIESMAAPSNFAVGDSARCESGAREGNGTTGNVGPLCDAYRVAVTNAGSQPTAEGSTVTLTDTLPAGVTLQKIGFYWSGDVRLGLPQETNFAAFGFCSSPPEAPRCELPFQVAPGDRLRMILYLTVDPGAPATLTNTVGVSGGGLPEDSAKVENANSATPAPFGLSTFNALFAGLDGAPDTQAGDHTYELTQTITPNSVFRIDDESLTGGSFDTSVQDVKDIAVDLPLGFAGSALSTPTCTLAQLSSTTHCPADTTVGHILVEPPGEADVDVPIWNIAPEHGFAAEFGFVDLIRGTHVLHVSVAPTPTGYVLRAISPDISQISLKNIVVNLYGDPAAHNGLGNTPVAQFTNPRTAPRARRAPSSTWIHGSPQQASTRMAAPT